METMTVFTVTEKDALGTKRLDVFISSKCGVTRSRAQNLIGDGESVLVNGKSAAKNYVIAAGDELTYREPEPTPAEAMPEDIPIEIVYEDDHLAVVNKPKGMVVHPAAGNYTGTLVSALLYRMEGRLSGIGGVIRPGIVHRIDKDTSGLLIIAKTDAAHTALAEQIARHDFLREYEGVVVGMPREDRGSIEKPIGRHPKDRKKMAVVSDGREACTDYEVLERLDGFSYIRFRLYTGRTHQIRVQFASRGMPLLGDRKYGSDARCPLALWCHRLSFVHPFTGQTVTGACPPPEADPWTRLS